MRMRLLLTVLLVASGVVVYANRERLMREIESYLVGNLEEPIPTMVLSPTDYTVRVRARGQLTGLRTTPVRPPAIRGSLKVAWVAEEGILVSAGALLLRFDNTDAILTLQENQNTVLTYDSRIKKSRLDQDGEILALLRDREAADLEVFFAQNQVRKDDEIFTQWEIQESLMSAALAQYKQLSISQKSEIRSELSEADRSILLIEQGSAQSEVEKAQRRLSSLELRAPTAGVLLYRRRGFATLEIGTEVWSGQDVLEIADMDRFQSEIWIVEADISGVEVGKPVAVTLDAFPSQIFPGQVEWVSRIAEQRSRRDPRRYLTCTVSLQVPPEVMSRLKPGMRLDGEIQVEHREQAFVLPKSAVFKEENQFMVFLKEGEEFKENPIRIVDSDHGFYVIEGVEAGHEVSLRNPFRRQDLHLPDFSGPTTANQNRRFIIMN